MIQRIPSLVQVYDIIRYHHENYDGSGCLKLKGSLLSIESQILRISDLIEIQVDYSKPSFLQKEKPVNLIQSTSGTLFAPNVVNAFLILSDKE